MKNEIITFSILMTNYNNARYIETAIKSVINQKYNNWELIIVDDNSTDCSLNKISKYLSDRRIKLIKHRTNLGYSGALKTAIENSQNDIVVILDADDKLHQDALELVANEYIKYPNYGFIYTSMWKCDSNLENCKLECHNPIKTFIKDPNISHLKTFKRKKYNQTSGFDINQKRSVDKDIILKLEEVTNFKCLYTPLYYYRQHDAGISQGSNSYLVKWYFFRAKYKAYLRRKKLEIPNYTRINLIINYLFLKNYNIINKLIFIIGTLKINTIFNLVIRKLNKYAINNKLVKIKKSFL